jgi:hypothetical protein
MTQDAAAILIGLIVGVIFAVPAGLLIVLLKRRGDKHDGLWRIDPKTGEWIHD